MAIAIYSYQYYGMSLASVDSLATVATSRHAAQHLAPKSLPDSISDQIFKIYLGLFPRPPSKSMLWHTKQVRPINSSLNFAAMVMRPNLKPKPATPLDLFFYMGII